MTDSEWEFERMRLYQLLREQPEWSSARLAEAVGHSESWVKKWRQRFQSTPRPTVALFQSQSRAPKTHSKPLTPLVRDAILSLRDQLKMVYHRIVGPKVILDHLQRDPVLHQQPLLIPKSTHTIWRVLKEAGRIPSRVYDYHPVERPAPMTHWEMDFGQLGDQFEFFTVVDRGTSILVETQTEPHFNAESSLLAVVELLLLNGRPEKLRFDRDSRLVSSWGMDGYPSPLMRFLWCVGVQPDPTPPRRPDLKPFVERYIRTLKHECLWEQHPADATQAEPLLREYRYFYNHERANQSSACQNRPPHEAFPVLPSNPHLPDELDPDAWVQHYHRQRFRRRVAANGIVTIEVLPR